MKLLKKPPALRPNRRGFTLLELVASMAILLLIASGVAMLIRPSVMVFVEGTNMARGKRIAEDVSELLISELLYAKELTLTESWSGALVGGSKTAEFISPAYGKMKFEQVGGKLSMHTTAPENPGEIGFGEEYYMQNSVQVGLMLNNGNQLTIEVAVADRNGNMIANKTRTVQLFNQNLPAPTPPAPP